MQNMNKTRSWSVFICIYTYFGFSCKHCTSHLRNSICLSKSTYISVVQVKLCISLALNKKPSFTFSWLSIREKADELIKYQWHHCKSKAVLAELHLVFFCTTLITQSQRLLPGPEPPKTLSSSTRCLNRLCKYFSEHFSLFKC